MPAFTSKRERRLWIALGIVLAGIYASMGQASAIVARIGEGILQTAGDNLVFALLILLVAIPIFFIRRGYSQAQLAIVVGILAVYLLTWLRLGSWEGRTHLVEYSMVAGLLHEALLERKRNGGRVPDPSLLALVIAVTLGWLDEGIQSLLPGRVADPIDIAFNSLAAVMIIGARWLLARVRSWRRP